MIHFSGVLVMAKPCGIVVNIKELFNCESISQVYGHLHDLLSQDEYKSISKDIYLTIDSVSDS